MRRDSQRTTFGRCNVASRGGTANRSQPLGSEVGKISVCVFGRPCVPGRTVRPSGDPDHRIVASSGPHGSGSRPSCAASTLSGRQVSVSTATEASGVIRSELVSTDRFAPQWLHSYSRRDCVPPSESWVSTRVIHIWCPHTGHFGASRSSASSGGTFLSL